MRGENLSLLEQNGYRMRMHKDPCEHRSHILCKKHRRRNILGSSRKLHSHAVDYRILINHRRESHARNLPSSLFNSRYD